MAPKKAGVKRTAASATKTSLLEKNLNEALIKQLKQSPPNVQPTFPDLNATTDERLNAFDGRKINLDVDSNVVISHQPLAISDALIFRFRTESDLLLDPESLFLYLRCSIKRIDENNKPVNVPPPVRSTTFVASTYEKVEISDEQKTINIDGVERRLPLLKRETVAVSKAMDIITGIGVTPSPLFPLTLWKNVHLKLGANQVEIPNSGRDLYYYQVYWLWLMKTKIEAMSNQLKKSTLFILDNSDSVDPFALESGLSRRYIAAAKSRVMEFCLPFHCDGLTNLDGGKFLPNDLDIQIELEKADNDIVLCSNKTDERFHVEIHEILLQARYTRLSASAQVAYNETLSRITASYTYTNHQMTYKLLSEGLTTYRMQIEDPLDNRLPERVFGFFISLKAFKGQLDKNSFWFHNHGLKKLCVTTNDGKKTIDLHTDFTTDDHQMFYNTMVKELNIPFATGNMQLLDYDSYGRGRFFFTFDNSRNHAADIHDSVPVISKRELTLEFAGKLDEDLVVVLMYFETRGLAIDAYRNVSVQNYH